MKYTLMAVALSIIMGNADARSHHSKPITPAFSAKSFLVADIDGQIIKEHDSDEIRPIASISKLMVALLATTQDMNEDLEIPKTRQVQSAIPQNVRTLTRKELLTLALIRSDNFAAQILCSNIENCVERMNDKARELGMTDTHYEEPTGLSKNNVSTAQDLLKLLMVVYNESVITELSRMPSTEVSVGRKFIKIWNTNPLTSKFDVILSKTGFTNPAGGCMVMILNSAVGQRILILLGSKNAHTRIPDMERLVKDLD